MPLLNDLVYTNSSRFEMGVLQSYDLDLDVAKDKNFELRTKEYPSDENGQLAIDCRSYISIDGTEYGGIVDSATHNEDDDDEMVYTGRTWRGILNSKYIYSSGARAVVASGTLKEEINRRLEEVFVGGNVPYFEFPDGVDSNGSSVTRKELPLFVCDEPVAKTSGYIRDSVVSEINTMVSGFVYPSGCSVYDGIVMLARSINHKLAFRYELSDKRVHIIPSPIDDYTEYLEYTKSNSVHFNIKNTSGAVNHIIAVGANEEGIRRIIHIFTNRDGVIQPYYVLPPDAPYSEPIKESEYITDTRNQVLFGLDENVKLYNGAISAHENYECMYGAQPPDWSSLYNETFTKEEDKDEAGNWNGRYVYEQTQPKEQIEYAPLTNQPENWYSTDPDAYGKYSDYYEDTSTTVSNDLNNNGSIDSNEHVYSNVSGETVLLGLVAHDSEEQIWNDPTWCGSYELLKRKPDDWDQTYTSYFERAYNGRHYVFDSVEPVTVYSYELLTKEPTKWKENYGSYFTKSEKLGGERTYFKKTPNGNKEITETEYNFEKEEYKRHRKKRFGKTFFYTVGMGAVQSREVKHLHYHVYHRRKKGGKWPKKWSLMSDKNSKKEYDRIRKKYKKHRSGNVYYNKTPKNATEQWRLETVAYSESTYPIWKSGTFYEQISTNYPAYKGEVDGVKYNDDSWKPGNIWRQKTGEKTPKFVPNKYFEQITYRLPPPWESGKYYKMLKDYYKDLCDGAISELKQELGKDSQTITLDDLDLDVGDLVGCYDDKTGWSMSGVPVTNAVVKISSGIKSECEYEVGGEEDLSIASTSDNSVEVYFDKSISDFSNPGQFKLRTSETDDDGNEYFVYTDVSPSQDVVYICIDGYDPGITEESQTTKDIPCLGYQFYWFESSNDLVNPSRYKAYE